ncbi:MAG: aldo/keto reductase [Colwellia sp.]|nr:aldo/keto reductase [Colwellia sp.]
MVSAARQVPPYRIILQARTTSSRLPAKVLLPVAGIPLSVLAARRAARNGADVVVAIPDGPEDRLLFETLSAAGLTVKRGPLHNVLERFLLATADLDDTAVCVRMTCDNPCPDADFIETLLQAFVATKARYLAYGNDGIWLPYGLSAEAFYVADLRAAAAANPSDHDREHVTSSIRAAHALQARPAIADWPADLGHLRCTVDTLEDYLSITDVFADIADPVQVPWQDLVARLQPRAAPAPADFILGGVQLGLPYGVEKDAGLMPEPQAQAILTTAAQLGCSGIDTARGYGESEARIGCYLSAGGTVQTLITKLAPLSETAGAVEAAASVAASLAALGQDRLDTLVLHRAAHLTAADGAIWRQLCDMQAAGQIGKLGVSVQTPEELDTVLSHPEVQHVQLPFNLLDWRWAGCIAKLRHHPDVVVHVRSVFLQGLLTQTDSGRWPDIPHSDAGAILNTVSELAQSLNRSSPADLCIAYVRAFSWVNGLVIGADTPTQVRDLAALFDRPPLTWAEVSTVQNALPRVSDRLLNPALWPQ